MTARLARSCPAALSYFCHLRKPTVNGMNPDNGCGLSQSSLRRVAPRPMRRRFSWSARQTDQPRPRRWQGSELSKYGVGDSQPERHVVVGNIGYDRLAKNEHREHDEVNAVNGTID